MSGIMNGKAKSMTAMMLAAAVLCGRADCGLVSRNDFDVPPEWTPKAFCGSDFHVEFYANAQSVRGTSKGRVDPRWDLDMFRESAVEHSAYIRRGNIGLINRKRRDLYAVPATNDDAKAEFTFWDLFPKQQRRALEENPDHAKPLFVTASAARPPFLINPYVCPDRTEYEAWKAKTPNFVGFRTLSEFDSELSFLLGNVMRTPDEDLRKKILKTFPIPKSREELLGMADRAMRLERQFHFGETNLWTLHSSCFTLAHIMARAGASGMYYEATGQEYAHWQVAGAFLRGACRQWNLPYGWYVAHWYTGYERGKNGPKDKVWQGSNYWMGDASPGLKAGFCQPWRGLGRTMLDRQNFYGWIIGSSFLEVEDWIRLYMAPSEDGKGKRPHEVALDLQRLYDLSKKTDRGVVYAPCAILVPVGEMYGPAGVKYGKLNGVEITRDMLGQSGFFWTLAPILSEDVMQRSLRRRGIQGCLFNSPFGEFYDVLAPDAGHAGFGRALGAYKAAFLVGDYHAGELDVAALEKFVRDGGTLFVSADRVVDGLLPEALTGVGFGDDFVKSGATFGEPGGRFKPLGDEYTLMKAKPGSAASPLLVDENGTVVAYANRLGAGKVVTVASQRMMPSRYAASDQFVDNLLGLISGRRTLEVIRHLLARVQDEAMPCRVEGDCQWGVNRTKDGWLFWAINNKGVEKFSNEPERLDHSKTVHVKAVFKPSAGGRTIEFDLAPGEWKASD